jgi:hypothetical protein
MGLLLLLLGCARQVTWQVQPRPSYALPGLEVSVVAGDRGCKHVADELASTLSARPGVLVRPDAPVRLQLQDCDGEIDTTVELESTYPGLVYDNNVFSERRRYDMRGWANAVLVVQSSGVPTVKLAGGAERKVRGPWVSEGQLEIPRALSLEVSVRRDLATDLADQVAPLPATIRRTLYRDPEPGTARQLHNEAVDAEREGDLDRAVELARQAYAANPTQSSMQYIEALQEHAQAVGYALVAPEAPAPAAP